MPAPGTPPRPFMRTPRLISAIPTLAAAAALGLATTLAIAWALAAWLPHDSLRRRHNFVDLATAGPPEYVRVYEFVRPGMVRRAWHGVGPPGPATAATTLNTDLDPKSRIALRRSPRQDRRWGALPRALEQTSAAAAASGAEDARGWPFLALWCSLDEPVIRGAARARPAPGAFAISSPGAASRVSTFRALPLRPIWPGLAANTAIYGAAWLLGLHGFHRSRRALRRRRGACPRCGYDLRRDLAAGCPECGWNRPY